MSAAGAMLKSEARLLARNPGVVIWTAVLPVAGAIVLAAIPSVVLIRADGPVLTGDAANRRAAMEPSSITMTRGHRASAPSAIARIVAASL